MKNSNVAIIITGVICLLSVSALFVISNIKSKEAGYVKPQFDFQSIKGIPEVEGKEYSEVDVDKGYRIGVCAGIQVNEDNEGYILFSSDINNSVYVKLRVIDSEDAIIAETGLIKSGEYIEKVKFNRKIKSDEKVTLKVMGYDPDTYYSMGVARFNSILKVGGN